MLSLNPHCLPLSSTVEERTGLFSIVPVLLTVKHSLVDGSNVTWTWLKVDSECAGELLGHLICQDSRSRGQTEDKLAPFPPSIPLQLRFYFRSQSKFWSTNYFLVRFSSFDSSSNISSANIEHQKNIYCVNIILRTVGLTLNPVIIKCHSNSSFCWTHHLETAKLTLTLNPKSRIGGKGFKTSFTIQVQ